MRDGRKHESDDVIDLETGERVALPAAEAPCALPALPSSGAPMKTSQPKKEFDPLDISSFGAASLGRVKCA